MPPNLFYPCLEELLQDVPEKEKSVLVWKDVDIEEKQEARSSLEFIWKTQDITI